MNQLERWLSTSFLVLASWCSAQQAAATGRIEGTVIGPLGQALVAGEVWAEYWGEVVARGRTDGSGAFVLTGVPRSSRCVVRATAPGTNTAWAWVDFASDQTVAHLGLRVFAAGTITGRVVDEVEQPVAGAHVVSDHDVAYDWYVYAKESRCVTDDEGRFVLEKALLGPNSVRVWSPGHQLAEQRLHLRDRTDLEFVLSPATGAVFELSLRGLDEDQSRAAVAWLSWTRKGSGEAMPTPLVEARFGVDGLCRLEGLPLDTECSSGRPYVPGLAFDPTEIRRVRSSEADHERERRFEFAVVPDDRQVLHGVVSDGEGGQVAGLELAISTEWRLPELRVVTDAEGRFEARVGVAPGARVTLRSGDRSYALDPGTRDRVSHRGEVTVKSDPDAVHEFVARRAIAVVGRVVDRDGHPIAHALVEALDAKGRYASASTRSRPDGRFEFRGWWAGPDAAHRFRASSREAFGMSEAVRLPASGTLELPPLRTVAAGRIEGTVMTRNGATVPGALVILRRCVAPSGADAENMPTEIVADAEGRFCFPALEPRGWRLHYPDGPDGKNVAGPWFDLAQKPVVTEVVLTVDMS